MKVCLSISHYHPEEWQPSWGIRTALTALIPFMVTPASGAIGSLDCPDDERRNLAHASRQRPPEMGSDESQQIATRCGILWHEDLSGPWQRVCWGFPHARRALSCSLCRMHRKIMETEAEAEGYDEGEKEAAPESSEPGGGNSRDSDGAKEDSPAASDSGKVQTDSETPEQTPAGLQKAQESPSLGTRRADHGGSSSPDSNPGVDLASGPSGLPPGAASESQQAGSSRTSASMGASSHTILRPRAPPAPPASDMRAPAASPSDRRAAPVAARAGVGQERLGNGRSAEIQGGVAGRRAGVEEPGVPRGGVR